MTARRTFGRRIAPATEAQRTARAAACWFYALFAGAMLSALQVERDGLRVLLVVLAFSALFASMAAASEA